MNQSLEDSFISGRKKKKKKLEKQYYKKNYRHSD